MYTLQLSSQLLGSLVIMKRRVLYSRMHGNPQCVAMLVAYTGNYEGVEYGNLILWTYVCVIFVTYNYDVIIHDL